jgi:magnesium transporter
VQLLTEASADELRRLVAQDEFFWLDLLRPGAEQVDAIGLDPEAEERALHFGRPPQLRRYRDHVGLVFFGAEPSGEERADLVEVHVYVSGDWVITLRQQACSALDDLRHELSQGPAPAEESVVGRVLAALAGSFEDLIDPIDARIERIERQAAEVEEGRAEAGHLRREILERRGRLLRSLRVVRRQRDYVDRAVDELDELPGLEPSQHHELRDVAGQMIRVADSVDDSLDRLAAALDLLNSSVANRMNAVMERLTIVATIFLPLTVVTGFFGQNFGWMVDRIDTLGAFVGFGIVLFAVSGLGIFLWVRGKLERPTPQPDR